jgi:hypothetical protein
VAAKFCSFFCDKLIFSVAKIVVFWSHRIFEVANFTQVENYSFLEPHDFCDSLIFTAVKFCISFRISRISAPAKSCSFLGLVDFCGSENFWLNAVLFCSRIVLWHLDLRLSFVVVKILSLVNKFFVTEISSLNFPLHFCERENFHVDFSLKFDNEEKFFI